MFLRQMAVVSTVQQFVALTRRRQEGVAYERERARAGVQVWLPEAEKDNRIIELKEASIVDQTI